MSRSLGVLTLDLIARTGGFEQGMDRASRRVRSTAQDMEAAKRVADKYIMAIGAAGVAFASAAAAMAVNAAKSMDATAKMAQQIGTTSEALTGMRFAAQQFANIGDQQFDMAMRRMTRRIAEAAEGSGAAKNALDAMGLSARELARLSPDKQMLAIADAMQRTERQADRLRYTMAIFDTEGMALVPALQQGAAAFEQNIELAKRFGVVLSTEAAQAAEQFTSNMSLLATRQEGFKNQLAEAVLPMLADLSGRLVEITQRIGPMGDAIEKALKAAGAAAAATAAIFVSRLVGSITASVAAWTAATAEAARYQMTLARMAAEAAKASTAITAMTGAAAGGMAVMGRAAQLALGVLGGPAGLLITAGLTAAAFLAMGRDARTAATDVDALTESLDTYNRRQLESAAFNLENDLVELNKQAEEHGQILRTLNADYEALTERYGENYEGLRNVRQAIREEEEALEAVIATIAKKSPLLAQIVQRLWDMDAASRGAAGGVEALNQAMHSEAGEKYLAQLQSQIKALQDGGDPIKMATRWISEHADATDADKAAIMSAAHALKALQDARDKASRSTSAATKALTEAQRAAQNFRREQERSLAAQYQEISNLNDRAAALEDQVRYYGLSESALNDLTIARLEEQKAALMGIEGAEEEIAIRERMIEQYKRIGVAMRSLEQKEAERQAWEDWARDVEQIFDRVGQSLTDAIFDGGKSGKELLKDIFKSLTFNVLINPVMGAMQGWVTNQLGGLFGHQNPQQQGGVNVSVGGFGGFGGEGVFGAGAVSDVGAWLSGSSVQSISDLGAKMVMSADKIAQVGGNILGYGSAIYDFSQGKYASAALTAAGQAIGGPPLAMVGNFVGGIVDSFFDREPTTRRGQRARVDFTGGEYGITSTDDRQPGAEAAIRQMAQQAVESANALMRQTGVDAVIDTFYAITESSIKGDRQGVASGGKLRIGDRLIDFGLREASDMTLAGFGGWSEAEMLPRLAVDIQLSVLEAFQALGDQLPRVLSDMLEGIDVRSLGAEEAQALAERFAMLTQGASAFLAAVEQMPFVELRDLSFDAAAGLVQFAGGLDNLLAAQQTYYERFYSDAERHAHAVDQLTQALAGVGVEMPALVGSTEDMLASYRALVESLDLNTEAGQQAYVTLMQTAGAFADVAEFAGQAAVEAARYAEQVLRERYGLETQLLQLQGNTIELRRRELEALDESNRALQLRIWALQDQKLAEEQRRLAEQEAARRASAERRDVLAARRAAEEREREAFEAALKSYEDGAKAFDELRQSLLSAGDAAGLLAATIERALSNPTGKYMAGGVEYDVPRWESGTTAAGFNYDWAVMQMRLARDLSDEISANALRIENAGKALTALAPNLGQYSPVVGPMAQALTNAIVEASGDIGYAVRDSVYEAMLGVAQRDVYEQFASRGPGLADIRYAQQQAAWASQAGMVRGFGWQYGADVVAYGNALDKLAGRMQSGQITAEQFDAAVEKLNEAMPAAAELLGDTEAQLERMADAVHDVAMAGARSIDHYFGELRKMAQELEATEEPINRVTAAIGRMNSFAEAFGVSAAAAGDYSKRTDEAALIAEAAGIAARVLTTADARAAAEKLAQDEAFAEVEAPALRDMSLLVDGIRAFDPDSWERAFIRISDALGQDVIDEDQFAALFNYSLDVFEDTARATEQLQASFNQLRDAAKSLADELLLDRNLTTLSFDQQYSEARRQFEDVMRRAMGGDVDVAGDLDRVTRNFLERSADSRNEIQYRRDFARAVNISRQIEQRNPVVDEIKRLNQEVEGLRAELRAANATVAGNTGDTTRLLRKIDTVGIKVQA